MGSFSFYFLTNYFMAIINRVDWGKEPTLRTNAHNFLHGLCIPEHYASKCVKESNQDKKQCYSTNIYNTKQLIKK